MSINAGQTKNSLQVSNACAIFTQSQYQYVYAFVFYKVTTKKNGVTFS